MWGDAILKASSFVFHFIFYEQNHIPPAHVGHAYWPSLFCCACSEAILYLLLLVPIITPMCQAHTYGRVLAPGSSPSDPNSGNLMFMLSATQNGRGAAEIFITLGELNPCLPLPYPLQLAWTTKPWVCIDLLKTMVYDLSHIATLNQFFVCRIFIVGLLELIH